MAAHRGALPGCRRPLPGGGHASATNQAYQLYKHVEPYEYKGPSTLATVMHRAPCVAVSSAVPLSGGVVTATRGLGGHKCDLPPCEKRNISEIPMRPA